jgi:hypothetical protein
MTEEEILENLAQYIINDEVYKKMAITEELWYINLTAKRLHKTPLTILKNLGRILNERLGKEYSKTQLKLRLKLDKEHENDKYEEWMRKWGAK